MCYLTSRESQYCVDCLDTREEDKPSILSYKSWTERACKMKGFHKHKGTRGLYKEADHAVNDESLATHVVDFRTPRLV